MPADALLDAAWDNLPRDTAARSLAVRIANLRSFLEPGRERGAPSSLLVRDGQGYRLAVHPDQVDALCFERQVRAAAGLAPAAALAAYDAALALWRGPPYAELAGAEFTQAEIRRLEELHSEAEEGRAGALVALGRAAEAVPELQRLVGREPLREELVGKLMLALYGAGRQVDALAAYRQLAARLRELGLQPGEAARRLERRILEHDPGLLPERAPAAAGAPVSRRRPRPPGASRSWRGCARR